MKSHNGSSGDASSTATEEMDIQIETTDQNFQQQSNMSASLSSLGSLSISSLKASENDGESYGHEDFLSPLADGQGAGIVPRHSSGRALSKSSSMGSSTMSTLSSASSVEEDVAGKDIDNNSNAKKKKARKIQFQKTSAPFATLGEMDDDETSSCEAGNSDDDDGSGVEDDNDDDMESVRSISSARSAPVRRSSRRRISRFSNHTPKQQMLLNVGEGDDSDEEQDLLLGMTENAPNAADGEEESGLHDENNDDRSQSSHHTRPHKVSSRSKTQKSTAEKKKKSSRKKSRSSRHRSKHNDDGDDGDGDDDKSIRSESGLAKLRKSKHKSRGSSRSKRSSKTSRKSVSADVLRTLPSFHLSPFEAVAAKKKPSKKKSSKKSETTAASGAEVMTTAAATKPPKSSRSGGKPSSTKRTSKKVAKAPKEPPKSVPGKILMFEHLWTQRMKANIDNEGDDGDDVYFIANKSNHTSDGFDGENDGDAGTANQQPLAVFDRVSHHGV